MKKIILIIVAIVLLFIAGLFLFISTSWDKTYDAPLPDITASKDSSIIAHGKHLVYGPAHCATCHVPMNKILEVENGLEMPLIGGWELSIPPGTFRAPNITPDEETGIGNISDGELARTLRYSVKHNGKFLMPFMPYQGMSDEDITAIISYLRSQKPVKNKVEESEFTFLGKALLALGAVKPEGPKSTPPKSVAREVSVEYGEYVVHHVAECFDCHTERNLKTGEHIGTPFAGGMKFPAYNFTRGYSFVSPNLTPDKETGAIGFWSEKVFVERFKAGRAYKFTPMPWGAYSRMDDIEIKAIYKYLRSLEPVKNKIEKTVYSPGQPLPE